MEGGDSQAFRPDAEGDIVNNDVLLNTDLPLPVFIRGKVRDTYDLGDLLLIIATDRISAFDVVLPCGIPNKGLGAE